jgi:tRNA(Ile)-lysidine synthase
VLWLRPLLGVRRAALRAFLQARGIGWTDDPTNDDPTYARSRVRQAMAALEIGVDGLAATAARMALARGVLQQAAARAAQQGARVAAGEVLLDRSVLAGLAAETRLRLAAGAVCWVTGAEYRPRFAALQAAVGQALAGRRATLAGCLLSPRQGVLRVGREPRAALAAPAVAPGQVWDGRWVLRGPGDSVRALGGAVADCPGARATGLPRGTLMASPALWAGDRLVAAPLAGFGVPVALEPARPDDSFITSLLSH